MGARAVLLCAVCRAVVRSTDFSALVASDGVAELLRGERGPEGGKEEPATPKEPLTLPEKAAIKALPLAFEDEEELKRVKQGLKALYRGKKKLTRLNAAEAEAFKLQETIVDKFFSGAVPGLVSAGKQREIEILSKKMIGHLAEARREAAGVTELVQSLGGVFVKLAQNLAVRADIVPSPSLRQALAATMDTNPPGDQYCVGDEPSADGKSLGWVIDKSLNVGSIGEAFLAHTTGDQPGVLKVTFPEKRAEYEDDFRLLGYRYGDTGGTKQRAAMRLTAVTAEEQQLYAVLGPLKDSVLDEFDLAAEARQTAEGARAVQRLAAPGPRARGFGPQEVHVPAVLPPHVPFAASQRSFMASELVVGASLKDRWAGATKQRVQEDLRYILDVYGLLVLSVGYFMADPHPGNFMVSTTHANRPLGPTPGVQAGGLNILDWGNTGELLMQDRCTLALFYVLLAPQEGDDDKEGGDAVHGPLLPRRRPRPSSNCEQSGSECFQHGCAAGFTRNGGLSCSNGWLDGSSLHCCKAAGPKRLGPAVARLLGQPGGAWLAAAALETKTPSDKALARVDAADVPDWGPSGDESFVPVARVVQVFKGMQAKYGVDEALAVTWGPAARDVLARCNAADETPVKHKERTVVSEQVLPVAPRAPVEKREEVQKVAKVEKVTTTTEQRRSEPEMLQGETARWSSNEGVAAAAP